MAFAIIASESHSGLAARCTISTTSTDNLVRITLGISPTQLLVILAIVALRFGTKTLRNGGGDLGGAIKGFKKALNDEDASKTEQQASYAETAPELIKKDPA